MSQTPGGVPMSATWEDLGGVVTHGPSGARLDTVPPKDNGGSGATFSPTDLVGAALASCALGTMALKARREGVSFGPASAQVEKIMTGAPRRIASLGLVIDMPKGFPEGLRATFEEAARGCPVARSLHPEVGFPMTFRYS